MKKKNNIVFFAIIMIFVLSFSCLVSCGGADKNVTKVNQDTAGNGEEAPKPKTVSFHDITFTVPGKYDLDNSISDDEAVYYKVFDEKGDPEKMIFALYQEGNRDDNILDERVAKGYCDAVTDDESVQGYNGYEIIEIDDKLSALYFTFQQESDGKTYNNAAVVFNNDEGHVYSIYATSVDDDHEELLHDILDTLAYSFEVWQRRYLLQMEVSFEENLFLDIYDVEVYLEDEKLGTVKQGDKINHETKLKEGDYTLTFYKSGNHDVSGSTSIHVAEDKAFYCTIKSHSEDIEIKDQEEEPLELDDGAAEGDGSGKYDLILTVNYESNLFFSKYDVDIYINSKKIGSVSQGESFKETINYKEGEHELIFRSSEDRTVKGTASISMDTDRFYSCSIKAHSDEIEISNKKTETVEAYNRKKALEEAQKRAAEARQAAKEREEAAAAESRAQFETAIQDSRREKITSGETIAEQYGYEVRLLNLDKKDITEKFNKFDESKRKTYRIHKVGKFNHDKKTINLIIGTVKGLCKVEKSRFSGMKKDPLKYAYDVAKEDGYKLVVKNRDGKRVDNKDSFKVKDYAFMSVGKVNYDKAKIVVNADTKKHLAELEEIARRKKEEKAAKLRNDAKAYAAEARDSITVYVTRRGTYHVGGCSYLNRANWYSGISYGSAKRRYHACMHCNPDTYCERAYESSREEYIQNHR